MNAGSGHDRHVFIGLIARLTVGDVLDLAHGLAFVQGADGAAARGWE